MAGHCKIAGDASRAVAANLRRLRRERGLSYAELSRRLASLGWPIQDTGLLKAEAGQRRIDVDDLVALASVLGAETADLLSGSPGAKSPDDIVTPDELAAELKVERDIIDTWRARGRGPRGFVIEGSLRFRRGEITRWLASCGDTSAGES
jgi:transcriptional regulator with XRE-family HTH domain